MTRPSARSRGRQPSGRDAPARVATPKLSGGAHPGATCARLHHAPAPASPSRNPRGHAGWTARTPVNPCRAVAPSPLRLWGPPEEATTQTSDDRTEAKPALQLLEVRAGATQGLQKLAGVPPRRSYHRELLQSKVALKLSLLDLNVTSSLRPTSPCGTWAHLLRVHLTPSFAWLVLPSNTGLLSVSPGHQALLCLKALALTVHTLPLEPFPSILKALLKWPISPCHTSFIKVEHSTLLLPGFIFSYPESLPEMTLLLMCLLITLLSLKSNLSDGRILAVLFLAES